MTIRIAVHGSVGSGHSLLMKFIAGSLRRIGADVSFVNDVLQADMKRQEETPFPWEESTGTVMQEAIRKIQNIQITGGSSIDLTDLESTFWKEPEGGDGNGYLKYADVRSFLTSRGFIVTDSNEVRNLYFTQTSSPEDKVDPV